MNEKRIYSASIVVTVLLILATVYGYFFILPPQLPLLYSLPRPQDQLVQKEWIFIVPVVAVLITALQYPFMRVKDVDEHNTTVKVFIFTSVFSLFLLAVAYIRILFLVT